MMLGIEEILCELGAGAGGGVTGGESEQQGGLPPGFRFHPTDEELITFYLASKVFNSSFCGVDIAEVDLNRCEPWELPEVAKMGEREWYFFSLRDRKYPTGLRTNRATGAGYWKATGKDREVYSSGSGRTLLGMKKTLVFYKGRAPHGEKTKWVMHEYRLDGDFSYRHTCKDEWVICRIFHKLGEKKSNGAHNFKQHQSSTITKKPLHEGTTPLMHENPPFVFSENHDEGLKTLLNLPSYPPSSIPFQIKQCKTEAAHFSGLQLPDANLRRWGTSDHHFNYNPPLPLPNFPFDFEQHDFGEIDYFYNNGNNGNTLTTTSGVGGGGDGVLNTSVYESGNAKISLPMGFDRVGFNQLLLPSI